MSSLWKPTSESVRDPELLLQILRGLYTSLKPSGVLLKVPTSDTVIDRQALLVCLVTFYGGAYILGAKNLPRPNSGTVSAPELLLPWLVKLYDAVHT